MDLDRMLDKCRQGQWRIDQLDWTVKPRQLSRKDEIAIVQYFTDMAAIERLAGALFTVQRDLVEDENLKKIFATFIADEERHAQAAEKLANHYNVHEYKRYKVSPELATFQPHFLNALRYLSPEIANIYITGGELMLDVALLRSLNDYVNDDMSNQVMDLINRDESRHIAMDYFMMEYYAADEYQERAKLAPKKSPIEVAKATWAFGNVLRYARPFLLAVFLNPMEILDPEGKRMKEAFKRMQLLQTKESIAHRPFPRFLVGLRKAYNTPIVGDIFGEVISRIGGAPGEYMRDLYTEEEAKKAARMSMTELADEAVGAKYVN
jgi:hypothetical protein